MTTGSPTDPRHLDDERVQRAAEGALRDAVAAAHLAACAECSARVARVRRLLAAAAALPRERHPERDLWAEIRRTIEARAGDRIATPVAPRRAWRLPTAIAASLLLAVVGLGTWQAMRTDTPYPVSGTRTPIGNGEPGTGSETFASTSSAADELAADLARRGDVLPPEARASLAASLRSLDRAIAEGDSALRAAPRDPTVVALLAAAHEQRLDLLRRTVALTEGP